MSNWNAIVVVVCAVLVAFMLWQEYRRNNRLRLPLRIIASLLAAVALACIALPVSYSSKSTIGFKDGVLLTPGFDQDSLPSYQNSKLFTTQTAIVKANSKFKVSLIDLEDIPQGKLDIAHLHVLGYGLNGDELKQLNHYPIQFHAATVPAGITAISWNHTIKTGERLTVQGKLSGFTTQTRIILKGLNTTLDSVIIPAKGKTEFELQATPKNGGRAVYTLLVMNGADTIEHEPIPFEVEPAKPVKVLMLATSPNFENRFLKNWLAQHGYGIAVRTAISKDKFSREYFNMDQTDVDHITSALLQKSDVVVGDLSSFKLLSSAENGAIQQQMLQKGLGVIVKADSSDKGASFLANAFAMDRLSVKDQKSASLNIAGQDKPSAKLMLDATFIKPQANTQPLVTDEQGHIIASSALYGSGKIVFTVLGNSFNWVLAGDQDDYGALWSMLINKASRKAIVSQQWYMLPVLPAVNEPVTIIVDGPTDLPLNVRSGNSTIAFAQNPTLPFNWNATYWPSDYGWQQITQNGAVVYWWYAYQVNDWNTLHASEKAALTKIYVAENITKGNTLTQQQSSVSIPVNKLYFYLLLLFCCTYLWVERKL